MPCNTLIEPACRVAGNVIQSVTTSAAGDVLGGIAQGITAGVRWIVENTATWWLRIPSPDLATEPAVTRIQQWLLPITVAVAIGGVITAGARMALTRRANPLIDVTSGLLTIAAASTLGVTAMTLLLKAGDAWSAWVLQASTGGHFTQRLILALDLGGGAAVAVVLICGTIAIVLSLVQAVLMLFRQAALDPQGHRLVAGADLLQASRCGGVCGGFHHDRDRWQPPDRVDGIRDAGHVGGHAACPDEVLHLDHRRHRRIRWRRPVPRRRHRRGDRRRRHALRPRRRRNGSARPCLLHQLADESSTRRRTRWPNWRSSVRTRAGWSRWPERGWPSDRGFIRRPITLRLARGLKDRDENTIAANRILAEQHVIRSSAPSSSRS
jgi:hypothetical protein